MDFSLAEERRLLQDSITRYLGREYTFDARRKFAASDQGFSRAAWAQFAELGLLALTLPEDDGGMGGTPFDTMLVMEAFGRALVVEPYLATVVLGAGTLAEAGTPAQREAWLAAVGGGEKLLAFAHAEAGARYDLAYVETRAVKDGSGWKLSGAKSVVLNGGNADAILVSARTNGNAGDETGLSLFLVDPKAKGVTVRSYPTQDGGRAAELKLDSVAVAGDALVGTQDDAFPVIERAVDRGIAALCAEAVGAMEALNAATLEYLKTRKQFGQPIGRFQALQHRMADMTVKAVEARSMAIVAASGVAHADRRERRRLVSAAKAHIGQCARFVGQNAVQLHGGIGVTDELIVSHWFKRLTTINATFGDAEHHLALVSDLLLTEPA